MELMLIITPLETDARTLSRPNTDTPARWERVGTKPPARLQLLREDPCVIKESAFRAKYADIFENKTTILSWTWRIYGIQYVKVDIRTNKPLNAHFRFRLSCRLRYRYGQQTRFIPRLCIKTMFVCFSLSINKRFMIDLWLFLLIFSFQIFLQTPTYIPGHKNYVIFKFL